MESLATKTTELDIAAGIKESTNGDLLIAMDMPSLPAGFADGVLFRNRTVIILCKAGGGSVVVDGKEYKLSRNNVVILPENHVINHVAPELLQECNVIAVSVDYILNMPSPIDTDIFAYSRYISVLQLTEDKFDDLLSYYRFLYKESHEPGRYQSEIMHSIFYALILEITAEYEKLFEPAGGQNIRADSLSDRFFRLLAVHYRQHRTVRFYADELHLTPKYLSTAIKRVTGRPILDWIHEAILIDAKMLLRTTDMTVQQISDQLNFSSPSAFVQFVRKHTGTTPRRL